MTNFEMKITGQRIKNLRIDLKLSQKDLADKIDVKQNTIAQYEKGASKISMDVLVRLAVALETTSDYLLGLTDAM